MVNKVAFDTSVLVAGAITAHADTARAAACLKAARDGRIHGTVTTHALAETWATLTAIPIEPRVAPSDAERLIARMAEHLEPVALTWEDYRVAMRRCADRGRRSGKLYDALHVVAAERSGAQILLSFNTRHFALLADPERLRILVPPDPADAESVLGD